MFPEYLVWIVFSSRRRECDVSAEVLYAVSDEGVMFISDPCAIDGKR